MNVANCLSRFARIASTSSFDDGDGTAGEKNGESLGQDC